MPDFVLRQHATFAPTTCRFCGDHEGPFIDSGVDDDGYGHIWICAPNEHRSGCLGTMAAAAGYVDPGEAQRLRDEIEELRASMDQDQTFTLIFNNATGKLETAVGTGSSTKRVRLRR